MLDKSFDPQEAEPRLYKAWEESGAFKPKMDTALEAYSIVIPPPNVTGSLHMGHALNDTLQDILIRFERMRGKDVLWQPGTDHAGIATQMVVERKLAAEGNIGRKDMTRSEFEAKVWEWKAESGGQITQQLRRLGASCDWSRERFTLGNPGDPNDQMVDAVMKVFVELYEQDLIYKDKRLVNWDPKFQTAISDLEVENREVDGHFWHFKYPLEGGETYEYVEKDEDGNVTLRETRDYISIATTRPETMLGDGAVAVHPDDDRYAPIVGKMVRLPLANRLIPIITDEYPDPDFGSGAVKITGAHDFNDYEVAKRNDIPLYSLMDGRADMCESEIMPKKYVGMDRFEARKAVVADIDAEGLLINTEDKKVMQPFGDRSGVVIEPMLTDQWFVDAKTLAKEAIAAVDTEKTQFVPANWKKTYDNWMHDIQPWCISRQLWWGHRIPVYYGPPSNDDGSFTFQDKGFKMFVAQTPQAAMEKASAFYKCEAVISPEDKILSESGEGQLAEGMSRTKVTLAQDKDVLDTWFSSGLWPFSTLGWPEKTPELERFYPGSVLVTAFDIIFFWVARMMMQGIHFMGEVPFRDVYIHALVLDEKGQKMSKSKGNVVNPLDLIEEYGADALRFTMAAMAAQGRNVRLSKQRIEGYRNFGTKLWSAANFGQMNECVTNPDYNPQDNQLSINRWIVSEAVKATGRVTEMIEAYRFNEAADAAYKFAWDTFANWYLEMTKPILSGDDGIAKSETQNAFAWVYDQILKMLHPFMPFLTEDLWGKIADNRQEMLILSPWPEPASGLTHKAASQDIEWLQALITNLRSVRSDMNIPPSKKAPLLMLAEKLDPRLTEYADILSPMARVEGVAIATEAPKGALQTVVEGVTYAIPVEGLIDLVAEKARLTKEMEKAQSEIDKIDKKLGNAAFTDKAPEHVVQLQKDRRASYAEELSKLNDALQGLS